MKDDKRDSTHYEGCEKDHSQCGDARLAEIRERRGKIARADLSVGLSTQYGNINASQVYAGDKPVCQMYNVPLHCGIDEMGDDPRVLKGLAYAHLFASAPADIDYLLSEVERAREEAADLRRKGEQLCWQNGALLMGMGLIKNELESIPAQIPAVGRAHEIASNHLKQEPPAPSPPRHRRRK